MTFEEDASDPLTVIHAIDELIDEFHPELINFDIMFKTVGIKIRYENFETHTRAKTLETYTNDKQIIKDMATYLVQPFLSVGGKIRLIGVRVSSFKSEDQKTLLNI